MFNFKLNLFLILLTTITYAVPHSMAQRPSSPSAEQPEGHQAEEYHESALRRFEIITLSSLPFTAIHSYFGVRTVRMIQENKIAPIITPKNYRAMGISAVSLSLFIGIYDWFHTRNVDRSAPSIPERKQPEPPTEEGIPPDGPLAIYPSNAQHASMNSMATFYGQSQQLSSENQLNMWGVEQSQDLFIPLFQMTF